MRNTLLLKGLVGAAGIAALLSAALVAAQTAPAGTGTSSTTGTATGAQTPSGATGANTTGTTANAATANAATVSRADRKIITDLAQGNMAEIENAKLAQSKTQNEQVKTYAQQMIDDHSKALTEVQQLASAKGVSLPTELDRQHKAAADRLGAKTGAAFDQAYMSQNGMTDHKKMHSMLVSAAKNARDPDLKALVTRLEPTVNQHLKAAQQNMASIKGSTAQGGKSQTSTEAGNK